MLGDFPNHCFHMRHIKSQLLILKMIKTVKLIEGGVLPDNAKLDIGLIYNLNAWFTDDRGKLVTEAYVKEEYKIQNEGVIKYV